MDAKHRASEVEVSSTAKAAALYAQKSKSLDIVGASSDQGSIRNAASMPTDDLDTDLAADVELPPPMKIQEHSFTSVTAGLTAVQEAVAGDQELIEPSTNLLDKGLSGLNIIGSAGDNSLQQINEENEQTTITVTKNGSRVQELEEEDEQEAKVSLIDPEQEKSLVKRNYVLQELVDTERDYVRDLGLIVNGYQAACRDGKC